MSKSQYEFLRSPKDQVGAAISLDDESKIALLAVSVAMQQGAGFKDRIDIRQFACPECGQSGFNSGWGFIAFVCGAKLVDDILDEPCGAAKESRKHGC